MCIINEAVFSQSIDTKVNKYHFKKSLDIVMLMKFIHQFISFNKVGVTLGGKN